ncbi:hypothetical protein EC82524_3074 [Escherichia coli 8.2524]|nr:hypothetical protein EC82524_3074 [Escherichia coli 8.2524]
MDTLKYEKFSDFDHNDPFFDSLKKDYKEFPLWLEKKPEKENQLMCSMMTSIKSKVLCI